MQKVNKQIKSKTKFNQWTNTQEVLAWFKAINNKEKCSFLQFDIVEFNPNISNELLNKALDFASKFVKLTPQERDIIISAKNTLLYNNSTPWAKRGLNSFFFV